MSLHQYAPENIQEFLDILKVLPVKVAKARSSHSVHVTIPLALMIPLKKAAYDLGLDYSVGRFYRRGAGDKCQIVVKLLDI
jgi:hypothetical protein